MQKLDYGFWYFLLLHAFMHPYHKIITLFLNYSSVLLMSLFYTSKTINNKIESYNIMISLNYVHKQQYLEWTKCILKHLKEHYLWSFQYQQFIYMQGIILSTGRKNFITWRHYCLVRIEILILGVYETREWATPRDWAGPASRTGGWLLGGWGRTSAGSRYPRRPERFRASVSYSPIDKKTDTVIYQGL